MLSRYAIELQFARAIGSIPIRRRDDPTATTIKDCGGQDDRQQVWQAGLCSHGFSPTPGLASKGRNSIAPRLSAGSPSGIAVDRSGGRPGNRRYCYCNRIDKGQGMVLGGGARGSVGRDMTIYGMVTRSYLALAHPGGRKRHILDTFVTAR